MGTVFVIIMAFILFICFEIVISKTPKIKERRDEVMKRMQMLKPKMDSLDYKLLYFNVVHYHEYDLDKILAKIGKMSQKEKKFLEQYEVGWFLKQ